MKKIIIAIILISVMFTTIKASQDIFIESKCNVCHSITSLSILSLKKDPRDLSKLKYFNGIEDKNELKLYLTKKVEKGGKFHPVVPKLDDEKINQLVKFLLNINK